MATPDGYQFDIFVSFPDNCNAADWVKNHFVAMLRRSILDVHGVDLSIFAFHERPGGFAVGPEIEFALQRSRILLPVLTPPYAYKSGWCCSEWDTFSEREKACGLASSGDPRNLMHPVLYSGDLSAFPEAFRKPRVHTDLRDFSNPDPSFRDSLKYHEFRLAVAPIAATLCTMVASAPKWSAKWPTITRNEYPMPPIKVPRI